MLLQKLEGYAAPFKPSTKFTTKTPSSQRGVVFFVILHALCAPSLKSFARRGCRWIEIKIMYPAK